jgi:hypothetical protein
MFEKAADPVLLSAGFSRFIPRNQEYQSAQKSRISSRSILQEESKLQKVPIFTTCQAAVVLLYQWGGSSS